MNRRVFLGLLASSVAGLTLDPERALWVPGAKALFTAPAGGWNPNIEGLPPELKRYLDNMAASIRETGGVILAELTPPKYPVVVPTANSYRVYWPPGERERYMDKLNEAKRLLQHGSGSGRLLSGGVDVTPDKDEWKRSGRAIMMVEPSRG